MYKISIDTSCYKPRRATAHNWEPGTLNDFMAAINGWTCEEPDEESVRWRLEFFLQKTTYRNEDPKWCQWFDASHNDIKFHDHLCDADRVMPVQVYGFALGYTNIDKWMEKLREEGIIKVPFSAAYDARQNIRSFNKCYLIIQDIQNEEE